MTAATTLQRRAPRPPPPAPGTEVAAARPPEAPTRAPRRGWARFWGPDAARPTPPRPQRRAARSPPQRGARGGGGVCRAVKRRAGAAGAQIATPARSALPLSPPAASAEATQDPSGPPRTRLSAPAAASTPAHPLPQVRPPCQCARVTATRLAPYPGRLGTVGAVGRGGGGSRAGIGDPARWGLWDPAAGRGLRTGDPGRRGLWDPGEGARRRVGSPCGERTRGCRGYGRPIWVP